MFQLRADVDNAPKLNDRVISFESDPVDRAEALGRFKYTVVCVRQSYDVVQQDILIEQR